MFTAIITTFNRDKFLKRAYRSVTNQSLKPKEIIIINNGPYKYSTKDFNYNKKLKFKLNVINNKKNLFQSKARNLGAQISKNNYLCFLDDDDKWEKNYLKGAYQIIKGKNPNIILSKLFLKKKIFKDPANLKINDILIKNPGITGSNIIIQKKTFMELKGYDSTVEPSEDKSLIIDALIKNKKIYISNKKVFFSTHTQSRLTKDYKKLSIGVKSFYKKYSSMMNLYQKFYVLKRICIYNIKSFRIYYLPFYIFFYILSKLFRFNSNY